MTCPKWCALCVAMWTSNDPNNRATLRDVLSHRTGFTRIAFLEINRGLSSDEILRRASSVEALAPFRQRFLYNTLIIVCVWTVASGVGQLRRSMQKDILPRKRRLEALLKELEAA